MSAGFTSACGIKATGQATCWGRTFTGDTKAPLGTFTQVSTGSTFACGIKTTGHATCWGFTSTGDTKAPPGTFTQVSSGTEFACGVKTTGRVACWGVTTTGDIKAPASTSITVSSGWDSFACGIKTTAHVICWGHTNTGDATAPSGTFTQVASGGSFACGIKTTGHMACWGSTFTGSGDARAPSGTFTQISAGSLFSCGVETTGHVVCWGYTYRGSASAPAGTFIQVSAGNFYACGVETTGHVVCWGPNQNGDTSAPSGTFTQVSTGNFLACAIKTTGQAVCWGYTQTGDAKAPSGTFTQVSAGNLLRLWDQDDRSSDLLGSHTHRGYESTVCDIRPSPGERPRRIRLRHRDDRPGDLLGTHRRRGHPRAGSRDLAHFPPSISTLSPPSGTSPGGTTVTITGTNLTGATVVKFGTTTAASFHVTSPTTIKATTPAHPSGTVMVSVTTPGGKATKTGFTFVVPPPSISNLTPTSGTSLGGTPVTITGTNLTAATVVKFGTTTAASFHVTSPTTIKATTPAHPSGTVMVSVTTPGGTATKTGFTFTPASCPPHYSGAYTGAVDSTSFGTQTTSVWTTTYSSVTGPATFTSHIAVPGLGANLTAKGTISCQNVSFATASLDTARYTGTTTPLGFNSSGTFTAGGGVSGTWHDQLATTKPSINSITVLTGSDTTPERGPIIEIHGTKLFAASSVRFGSTTATNLTVTSPTNLGFSPRLPAREGLGLGDDPRWDGLLHMDRPGSVHLEPHTAPRHLERRHDGHHHRTGSPRSRRGHLRDSDSGQLHRRGSHRDQGRDRTPHHSNRRGLGDYP